MAQPVAVAVQGAGWARGVRVLGAGRGTQGVRRDTDAEAAQVSEPRPDTTSRLDVQTVGVPFL